MDSLPKEYSEELGLEILAKIREKGWNLYSGEEGLSGEDIIRKGPSENLELNTHYTLLPKISDPKNPQAVFEALDEVAKNLNRRLPEIRVDGINYPFMGITLNRYNVKISTEKGTFVAYPKFFEALDSIYTYYG